ncbi:MAG: hypothetical protein RUMPE_00196 [Eubacteriales bacterium SKADARSKE-1]|nr:hypothetical protein [Eubacteriales bacterium SKADARSKE-1]
MKKVLSIILSASILLSSIGAVLAFADEPETTVSASIVKETSEGSVSNTELEGAIGKLKENIIKLEVKSFWQRNKSKILKITGGTVAGVTLYFLYKLGQVPNNFDLNTKKCTNQDIKNHDDFFSDRGIHQEDAHITRYKNLFSGNFTLGEFSSQVCKVEKEFNEKCKDYKDHVVSGAPYLYRVLYNIKERFIPIMCEYIAE